MKSILYYLLQVIIASGILYSYYHLVLRNKKFHQYNRFYLLAAFVISILIPFLNIPVYFSSTETDSSFILQTLTSLSTSGNEEPVIPVTYSPVIKTNWFTWQNVLYIFYIIVAAIVLIRILFSLRKIRFIIRNNPVEKLENIHFVNTDEAGTPFSFFRWLFWNRQIELRSEKGEQIFRHELFHIQQRHSRDIIFMELMMVVFWINPFFHLIKKEIKAIHEFLADKFAINENNKWEYAELLLMQALGAKQHLVNPFFHNQIKRRIAMISTSKNPGYLYLRKLMVLPIAAIVVALFAFSYKNKETVHKTILSEKTITVVIDAGHGGTDQGVLSIDKKYTEAQLTLQIAQQIQKFGKEYNINVLMTRESNQFPAEGINQKDGLWSRVAIAKKTNPDAFISIHINTASNADNHYQTKYSGFEAYVSGKREDADSKLLASAILKNLAPIYKTEMVLKQSKENGIYVLDQNSFPATLLECGYMNNSEDLAFITNKDNQEKIARNILEALVNYKSSEIDGVIKGDLTINKNNAELNPRVANSNVTLSKNAINIHGPKDSIPSNTSITFIDDRITGTAQTILVEGSSDIPVYLLLKEILNKKSKVSESREQEKSITENTTSQPLVIIDGVKQKSGSNFKDIDPVTIGSINVFKEQSAIAKYGEKGKNGVIEIFTKKKNDSKVKEIILEEKKESDDKVFEKVEIEPSFPGGDTKWRQYLEKNANGLIPIDSGAPPGQYITMVKFLVHSDGFISDIKAITNHGYGMENEAIRLIAKGPKWVPAIQNGKFVNSYRKQPITFLIAEENNNSSQLNSSILKEVVVTGIEKDKGRYTKLWGDAPSFVGGEEEWRKYLERNVNATLALDNGAPVGTYTTQTQFLVHADGTISEIKSLTKKGYGMEEEALRVIQSAEKLEPAVVNGEKVSAYKIQPITFLLVDYGSDKPSVTKTNLTKPNAEQLSPIYPNPSNNFLVIPFNSQLAGKGEIRITDISGNSKMTIPTSFAKGANNLSVNVASLAKGMYVVNVIDASKKIARTYRMIKQ